MRAAEWFGPQILFDFSPENREDRRLIYGASSNAKEPKRRPAFPWDYPIMSNPTKTQYKSRSDTPEVNTHLPLSTGVMVESGVRGS